VSDFFDWDTGNWPKCGKHGLAKADIEAVFTSGEKPILDQTTDELRFRIVGPTPGGRMAFVVFTIRHREGSNLVRPISARYMHAKEIKRYEQTKAKAVSGLPH
jgi:uncharacterized protein